MNTTTSILKFVLSWEKMFSRPDVELLAVKAFFIVAHANGNAMKQAQIREQLGVSESTASRNIALLGIGATPTQPGPGLVESFEDPMYRRSKLVRLTAKGKQFAKEIDEIFQRSA